MRASLIVLLTLPELALAATLRVPEDHADVATAVGAAADGDVIEIGPGTWVGSFTIDKDLELRGTGEVTLVPETEPVADAIITVDAATVTLRSVDLDGAGIRAITATGAELHLSDLSITGAAHAETGGAIDVEGGSLQLERVQLVDNRSSEGFGGHVAARDARLTLIDGRVEGGRAERGGGLFVSRGELTIRGTTFVRNAARRDDDRGIGGAIATELAVVAVQDARFEDNRVTDGQGGQVSVLGGEATFIDTAFVGKPGSPSATEYFGGGLAIYDAPLTIRGCSFEDLSVEHSGEEGSFGYGGALIIYGTADAPFLIEDSSFTGNAVSAFGGAVRIDSGEGTLDGCTFEGNTADYGGAVHIASSTATRIEASTFRDNQARYSGAIRWRPPSGPLDDSVLTLIGNRFEGNVSDNYGGVMYARAAGRLEARDNAFTGNTGTLGGALMLWSVRDVELVRNTFCTNLATGGTAPDGGAIASYRSGLGTYHVRNNSFIENQAGAWGGGVSFLQDGDVDLVHNTFVGNQSPDGSAIGLRGAESGPVVLRMHDDLLAYQSGGEAIAGSDVARLELAHSALFGNAGGDVEALLEPVETDVIREDPRLQSFTVDGACAGERPWPVWGSPLIDAADPAVSDLDGSRADIGATGGPDADPALWADLDEDGSPVLFDCDDADAGRSPITDEIPYDGIDQDCDEADLDDVDGDGFAGGELGPDCDDALASVNPGAEEVAYDGIDQDCDGSDRDDLDGDGYPGGEAGTDCDETDASVNPGAEDLDEDGVDQDCDGIDGQPGCGCDSASGTAVLPLVWLGIALLVRRRTG